ncbi:virion assembly protein [Cotia virus SPAn232]|uniref:Virion assembly protein n=2 Tax=Cotia virus TaxID=39444 RepID=H6TA71_9POXV|nr:virion assembly protein [Cotia virus SPAn232]ADT91111.1 virion assembly protein [Cotia virus SPAn232]AIT70712.1 virion assembly protein [Cotia virus]
MSKSIDIDIIRIKDNIYPRIFNLDIETFCIVGNKIKFIKDIIKSLYEFNIFMCEYNITPDKLGTLEVNLLNSSFKINNRFITIEEFKSYGCPLHWCKYIQYTYNDNDYDNIKIYDMIYKYNNDWSRIIFLQCPYIKDSSYETFLTNPFSIGSDHSAFKNILIRSYINSLIFNNKTSPLYNFLNYLVQPKIKKIKVLIDNNSYDDLKLVTLSYDRNRFNAFIYAWFNKQAITSNKKENENIEKELKLLSIL